MTIVALGACTVYFREPVQQQLATVLATPALPATATPPPDYAGIVEQFRRAESAALYSALEASNADVMAALAVFASGDALASVQRQVADLQRTGSYVKVIRDPVQIEQAIIESANEVKLLTNEAYQWETYARSQAGDSLQNQAKYTAKVAYKLTYDGQRWRVDDLGLVEQPTPAQ